MPLTVEIPVAQILCATGLFVLKPYFAAQSFSREVDMAAAAEKP